MRQLWRRIRERISWREACRWLASGAIGELERRLDVLQRKNANLLRHLEGRLRYEDRLRAEIRTLQLHGANSASGLTAAEVERLAILAEECGEVV